MKVCPPVLTQLTPSCHWRTSPTRVQRWSVTAHALVKSSVAPPSKPSVRCRCFVGQLLVNMAIDSSCEINPFCVLFFTARPKNVLCVLHYKNQESVGVPELFTCRWDHLTSPSLKINYTVLMGYFWFFLSFFFWSHPYEPFVSLNIYNSICISFSTSAKTPSLTEICISRVTNCTYKDISLSGHLTLFDNHIVIVRAETATWKADSDPFEFDPEHISKFSINIP